MITVAPERDAAVARACAQLRQRVFMQTYGPVGLVDWPGEPDAFDTNGTLFTARQNGEIVGTALLHHALYDGTQPFWHERFGLTLGDLVSRPVGRRIGEVGRVAVDKAAVTNPLQVAGMLAAKLTAAIRDAAIETVIACAFTAPMLAFYRDLVRRSGGQMAIHPQSVPYAGVEMTFMVITTDDVDYV